jgi:hypothetical protein
VRCIYCEHDSKYKDRQDGHCPGCHKAFAFEPRKGAPITDMGFKHAIEAVSADGHVRWGVEHLYYEVCRRVARARRTHPALLWTAIAICALFVLVLASHRSWTGVTLVVALGLGLWFWGSRGRKKTVAVSQADFERMWATWRKVHHDHLKGLIVRKEPSPRSRPTEPDVALYSFDRAVICDRARTVDLLLANNFHFENNCAVLSIEGYPPGPFATVRTMLKRNPRLQVFALHDASGTGCRMAYRLANEEEWFKGQAKVIDVGLRPVHARSFRGVLLPAHGAPLHPGHGITEREAAWLSSYILDLAAIRPEQVLKRLYRAINRKAGDRDGGGADGSGSWTWGEGADSRRGEQSDVDESVDVDTDAFGSDAGDMDGDGDGDG